MELMKKHLLKKMESKFRGLT